jgi:uncharacterized protein YdaU (DUF1376 family)
LKPPAFQFYVDDFIGGTATMSHDERGFYILALCVQWSKGGINNDEFARLGRGLVEPSINHVKTKFEVGADGLLRNRRLEEERAKQKAFRERCAEAGRRSVEGRLKKPSRVVQPMGEPNGNTPISDLHSPISIKKENGNSLSSETLEPRIDPPSPAPPDIRDRIPGIHTWYCEQMGHGHGAIDAARERQWFEWFKVGFQEDDFKRVLKYLRNQIDLGARNHGALKLSNILMTDKFGEDLMLAKQGLTNGKSTHQQRPNERLVGVSRNNAVNDYAAAAKRKLERQMVASANRASSQVEGT